MFEFEFIFEFVFSSIEFGFSITFVPVMVPVPGTAATALAGSALGVIVTDFTGFVPVAALPSGPFLSFRLDAYNKKEDNNAICQFQVKNLHISYIKDRIVVSTCIL